MTLIGETQTPAAGGAKDWIKDGMDASFMADVIEMSRNVPVIVDFWATWCGPCKTLGPILEKTVAAAKGAVRLVKIDVDKQPGFAGQLSVQSIPTVYAFVDGQPVDRFQGAQSESRVKAFIDKLVGPPKGDEIEAALAVAKESISIGDLGGAARGYAAALSLDPSNLKAIGGLARCYLSGGDNERAAEVVAMVPETASDADVDAVRAALAANANGETKPLENRLAKDADDHEARFALASALAAGGEFAAAADQLLEVIARDRTWNDEAARRQLLTVFEAAGSGSDVAKNGRRRLSSILFS